MIDNISVIYFSYGILWISRHSSSGAYPMVISLSQASSLFLVVYFDFLKVLYFIVPLDSQSLGQDDPLSSFWSDLSFKGSYIVFAGM